MHGVFLLLQDEARSKLPARLQPVETLWKAQGELQAARGPSCWAGLWWEADAAQGCRCRH